jgi:hypothetical protein
LLLRTYHRELTIFTNKTLKIWHKKVGIFCKYFL